MKIGDIVRVVGICLYFGMEAVIDGFTSDKVNLRILVDEPGTGNLIPGSLAFQLPARLIAPAPAETIARVKK